MIYNEINNDFYKSLIGSVSIGYKLPPQEVKEWRMSKIIEANKYLVWNGIREEKAMKKQ